MASPARLFSTRVSEAEVCFDSSRLTNFMTRILLHIR
jgi:hypothetical protein